jgi:hypothetical protein
MPGYNSHRQGTARTSQILTSPYFEYCLCVNVWCTAATGCQPNCGYIYIYISYHIISYHIISYHNVPLHSLLLTFLQQVYCIWFITAKFVIVSPLTGLSGQCNACATDIRIIWDLFPVWAGKFFFDAGPTAYLSSHSVAAYIWLRARK